MGENHLIQYSMEISLLLRLKHSGLISDKEYVTFKKLIMKGYGVQSDLTATA